MALTARAEQARKDLGRRGEDLAVQYLGDQGYTIVGRNWRFGRLGELDIVAVDPSDCLVAVEVKTRRDGRLGGPLEAVTPAKVERLGRLAAAWCRAHEPGVARLRVDVIGIEIGDPLPARVTHVQDVTR